MKYDLLSVKTALEVLYSQGFTEIRLEYFLFLFCEKYGVDMERENRRIRGMLNLLDKKGKIRLENDDEMIMMENMLTSNLRLVINR